MLIHILSETALIKKKEKKISSYNCLLLQEDKCREMSTSSGVDFMFVSPRLSCISIYQKSF
ncbi:unnamed protein product, partial [Vitis vinifera]|uniref:Uncharacterized protein n=1 Tax=Vitis vinifera TaxID=29760 RepID=E0CPW0_VITVI